MNKSLLFVVLLALCALCTLDCYFNSSNFVRSIDGSKVLATILANPNFTAEWTSIVTEAVNNCTTGANDFVFDTSKMPPPPPSGKPAKPKMCNFKAMAFVGCVKRYLTIYTAAGSIDGSKVLATILANPNFTAEWTSIVTEAVNNCTTGANAPCTEMIDKLKVCDPFFVPPRRPGPPTAPTDVQGANPEKVKVAQKSNMRLSVGGTKDVAVTFHNEQVTLVRRLVGALCSCKYRVAASPRKDDRRREGRDKKLAGFRNRMPFLEDPKMCWPTIMM
ncbi:hypothetical protein B566_EDAN018240, partial [Ephemera danica]